jgi:aminoglycoside phosphotransferase (APT) family kinase protein
MSLLTAFLRQKQSLESKKLDGDEEDADPCEAWLALTAPWSVRRGVWHGDLAPPDRTRW